MILLLLLQISDPHGSPALHHQAQPAQLSAFAHGHSARAAPPGRILHPLSGQMAPGLLQVSNQVPDPQERLMDASIILGHRIISFA